MHTPKRTIHIKFIDNITSHLYNIKNRRGIANETRKMLKILNVKNACIKVIPEKDNFIKQHVVIDSASGKVLFKLREMLGSQDSADGEAWLACKPNKIDKWLDTGKLTYICTVSDTNYMMAIKHIPITEIAGIKSNNEINILKKISRLVEKGICPNLPMYYGSFICNNAETNDFKNPNIINHYNNQIITRELEQNINAINDIEKKIIPVKQFRGIKKKLTENIDTNKKILESIDHTEFYINKSYIILNEIANLDFNTALTYFPTIKTDNTTILSTIFQVLAGLYAIQKYLKLVHFDLHLANVLVTAVKPGGYWHYNIDGKHYYVPNTGYLIKLWDFGRSYEVNDKNIINDFQYNIKYFFNLTNPDIFIRDTNKNLKNNKFREYVFAFDVYRFFSAYSYVIGKKTPKFIKKLLDYAMNDIVYNISNNKLKKHKYLGTPKVLIPTFFEKMFGKLPANETICDPIVYNI